jgi:hypothetical protein
MCPGHAGSDFDHALKRGKSPRSSDRGAIFLVGTPNWARLEDLERSGRSPAQGLPCVNRLLRSEKSRLRPSVSPPMRTVSYRS